MKQVIFIVGKQSTAKTEAISCFLDRFAQEGKTVEVAEIGYEDLHKTEIVRRVRKIYTQTDFNVVHIFYTQTSNLGITKWAHVPDRLAQPRWYRCDNGQVKEIICTFEGLRNQAMSNANK